jgi:acyl-CoA synthetase (AMP-forming)/AMP-acid ligase II
MTGATSNAAARRDLVPARLQRHARERPAQPIVSLLDDAGSVQASWTFGELDRRARSLAAHLQRRGAAGEAILLAYASELEFVSAFSACLYARAIAVPTCLPRLHGVDDRMSAILADSGARYVLTSRRHQAALERHLATRGSGVEVVATDALPERSEEWSPPEFSAGDLAMLQYTSGSTRSPSGVMVRQGDLAANLEALRAGMGGTGPDSVGISWLPLFHDMGLIAGLLTPLWVGYPVHLMPPAAFVQSPLRWLRAFTRHRGTIGGGPNFAYQACVDAARSSDIGDLDLSRWRVAWNGAEPIRASTLDQFRETFARVGFRPESLTPSYGLAEATLLVTADDPARPAGELVVDEEELRNGRVLPCATESPRGKRLVGSGRPTLPTTQVRIVHPDASREAEPGQVGEVWVRSDSVGQGYWRKPEETRSTFGAHLQGGEGPFLRTGDLGFLNGGELFVTGRLKDVIVIRGVNYYPHDLERTVEASHPALRPDGGAVVGLEEGGRVQLVVVQEVRRECWRTVAPPAVFDAIRRAVAREHHLALQGIVLLKPFGLPKTSSGKVQRSRCRAGVQERSLPSLHEWWASAVQVAPIDFDGEPLGQPGVLERQLVHWLQRELSLDGLTWKTPLMELGIDSLKGVELANALSSTFDRSWPATLVIDHPTVESLAAFLRQEVLGVPSAVPAYAAVHTGGNGRDAEELAAEIGSLGEEELDALLKKSIEEVLEGGGPA